MRDYGTARWEGGDPECTHVADERKTKKFGNPEFNKNRPSREATKAKGYFYDAVCGKCGAKRVDAQLGSEEVPDCLGWATKNPCGKCFVCHMVEVFREVRRVLRDDGTLWLNLGDSYFGTLMTGGTKSIESTTSRRNRMFKRSKKTSSILKPKDLCGMPWRVALALQADGWYLRQDILWSKPAPMPGSQQDRCTTAHEYVFLLTKRPRYFFDWFAIRERAVYGYSPTKGKKCWNRAVNNGVNRRTKSTTTGGDGGYRMPRSVWTINTYSFRGSHFATMPPKLVDRCVRAGTSEKGCCPECGTPWRRVLAKDRAATRPARDSKITGVALVDGNRDPERHVTGYKHAGWEAGCTCGRTDTVPAVVFDPFFGAGTCGLVAKRLGRRYLGIELNPEYAKMGADRIYRGAVGFAIQD